jgi:hypothetical protein
VYKVATARAAEVNNRMDGDRLLFLVPAKLHYLWERVWWAHLDSFRLVEGLRPLDRLSGIHRPRLFRGPLRDLRVSWCLLLLLRAARFLNRARGLLRRRMEQREDF